MSDAREVLKRWRQLWVDNSPHVTVTESDVSALEALLAERDRLQAERTHDDTCPQDEKICLCCPCTCPTRDELRADLAAARMEEEDMRKAYEEEVARCVRAEEKRDVLKARVAELSQRQHQLVDWWSDTEARSAEAHDVYQAEAHRRGDVRHPDAYADLSEATKEWDRVLVRWVHGALTESLTPKPVPPEHGEGQS